MSQQSQNQTVVLEADLDAPPHQRAIIDLTSAYAEDPMGNGAPLPDDVLERLVPGLRAHPTALIMLAFLEGQPVGIATCFVGFSTFAARPLVNIHDLAVLPGFRGRGVGTALLAAVERAARKRGCVKVTLEVQENNERARAVYRKAGFGQAVYGPDTGGSLFYAKRLEEQGDE